MRSHAKASTAGSTQRQAKGLGRIFRGAHAIRGGSHSAKRSGAPKSRRLALSLALFVALFSLALGVGSASAVAPTIVSTSVSAVTTKTAVLEAEINPGEEATTFRFEYGLADCASNPCTSVPVPNGNVGSGSSAVKVAREIEGLSPGTTYHFRVLAVNASGPAEGPDRTFTTYSAPAPDTNCPNQAFRYGPGTNLPDCRAYEMVSPIDKNGGDIRTVEGYGFGTENFRSEINQASLDGDKYTFSSYKAFAGAVSAPYSVQYIASRGADDWSTQPISPPSELDESVSGILGPLATDVLFKGFTDDLSTAWFTNGNRFPLTADGIEGLPNLYARDNADGSLHALTIGEALSGFAETIEFSGHSGDGRHGVFSVDAALTPDAALNGDAQVYDFFDGELHLVSKLPGGEADPMYAGVGSGGVGNERPGAYHGYRQLEHAVSDDGSRIFWSSSLDSAQAEGSGGKIYVRIDGQATIPVSEGVAWFWTARADGAAAIYGEESSVGYEDLYEFDVDTETRTLIAGEVRGVLGASDDLSRLYFVSKEDLASGATAGERNLYLNREGTTTFIAMLAAADTGEVNVASGANRVRSNIVDHMPISRGSRVTDDGRHIAFMSTLSLTGYDNTDAIGASPDSANGNADFEVFTYDADANELSCASCNPSGARPVGRPLIMPYNVGEETFRMSSEGSRGDLWATAWLPTWENSLHASRALSQDGNRVFFNSFDALVPQDTNGKQDVYQWEAPGLGTCTLNGPGYSQLNDGCVSLISTGQSAVNSEFMDATPNGESVFIRTDESIDPRDPSGMDVYAARVGGGYPPPPPPPTPCIGDACQDVPAPPNDPTPASASFRGAGNATPAKPRRSCRARARKGKANNKQKQKRAKRCKRSSRRAGR